MTAVDARTVQSCQQLRLRVFHYCVIYNALGKISSTHNIIAGKNLSGSISGAHTLFLLFILHV